MNPEPVLTVLASLEAPCAIIGAHAMAVRGYPRFTIDVDILTTDDRVLDVSTWDDLRRAGATADSHRGDVDDPLGGVVHILLPDGTDVDVIVAKWKWEAQVIERAEVVRLANVSVRVPRISDLILLKLAAGGYADLQDAAALLALGDAETTTHEVDAHIVDVRPDVRTLWQQLLADRRR